MSGTVSPVCHRAPEGREARGNAQHGAGPVPRTACHKAVVPGRRLWGQGGRVRRRWGSGFQTRYLYAFVLDRPNAAYPGHMLEAMRTRGVHSSRCLQTSKT